MSAGFWIRRKKAAAKKRKELLNAKETVANKGVAEKATTEKPVKKAVQKKDANGGTDKKS